MRQVDVEQQGLHCTRNHRHDSLQDFRQALPLMKLHACECEAKQHCMVTKGFVQTLNQVLQGFFPSPKGLHANAGEQRGVMLVLLKTKRRWHYSFMV